MFSIFRLRRARGSLDLIVGMAGVRLGERLLQAGASHPRAFAVLAGKSGLTGRACAVVDAPAAARPLEAAAAEEGVLVEVITAQGGLWPFEEGSFDVGVLDGNALLAARPGERTQRIRDMLRAVRPSGRVLTILAEGGGIAARFGFAITSAATAQRGRELAVALQTAGFRPVRVLAGREGILFVEGFRPAV
jgi:hypothetical protein